MKRSTYTTTRFDVDGEYSEFYVEVSPNKDMYEFVLCMDDYGLKSFMFGLSKIHCPEEQWEEIIENNVEDYIAMFLDDMDYWDNQPID